MWWILNLSIWIPSPPLEFHIGGTLPIFSKRGGIQDRMAIFVYIYVTKMAIIPNTRAQNLVLMVSIFFNKKKCNIRDQIPRRMPTMAKLLYRP